MKTLDAISVVSRFAALQGKLVRRFLDSYAPADRQSFRDVPNGVMPVDGDEWTHRRHGYGVLFANSTGVQVNAHVGMADFPEGIDGGRLCEYLESIGVTSVALNGREYTVDFSGMNIVVDEMVGAGLLRPVVVPHDTSQMIFELVSDGRRP